MVEPLSESGNLTKSMRQKITKDGGIVQKRTLGWKPCMGQQSEKSITTFLVEPSQSAASYSSPAIILLDITV